MDSVTILEKSKNIRKGEHENSLQGCTLRFFHAILQEPQIGREVECLVPVLLPGRHVPTLETPAKFKMAFNSTNKNQKPAAYRFLMQKPNFSLASFTNPLVRFVMRL